MTMIPLERLKSNPYRDFELHPYDPEQIEKLKASIDADGFWMSVVARKAGDGYEIAFGHHRIEAARQLGWTEVPIEVRDLTDWHMARMLASENATQRGSTAAAALDAVAALSKVLAYRLLRWENEPTDAENTASVSGFSHEHCRGLLLAGEGVGRVCIEAAATKGSFTREQIEGALATLKQSGRMSAIVAEALALAESELRAEQEAAERALAAAEQKEAKARTKREREAASKVKNKAKRTAGKARMAVDAAATAETATRGKQPIIFDARCVKLFRTDAHAATFREIVTGETFQSYLPVSEQFEFAKEVIAKATENRPRGHSMTAEELRIQCWSKIESAMGLARRDLRTSGQRPSLRRIRDGLNFLRRAEADHRRGVDRLLEAARVGEKMGVEQLKSLEVLTGDLVDSIKQLAPLLARKSLKLVGGEEA